MKKMKLIALLAVALFAISACNENKSETVKEEGKVMGNLYQSEEAGWKMRIPEGFRVTARDEVDERYNKGFDAVEEATGQKVDMSSAKYLLNYNKDKANSFIASSEDFTNIPKTFEENFDWMTMMIYETYASNNMFPDTTTEYEQVDGLEFKVLNITLYTPDGDTALQQKLYGRLINNHLFTAVINYNNAEDGEAMTEAWRASKFSIRD